MLKKEIKTLLLIFVFTLALRVMFLPGNKLTFGYDQGRDAFRALEIVSGDLKILGPPASTPGLYHGALWFYVLAPAYLVGNSSPIVAAFWIALLNSLTIFVLYKMAYLMTKSKKAGILSALLFAVSFEASQYATWLSNPTLGVLTVPLMYLGLWMWINKKKYGPIIAAVGLGTSIQSEIFLAYHLVPLLIWLFIARTNINIKQIFVFLATLAVSVSTMILVEIKFGFQGISGLFNLLTSQDAVVQRSGLGDFAHLYLNQIGKTFSFNLFPLNVGYGGTLGLLIIIYAIYTWHSNKKRKTISWEPFLATYVLSHITVVSVGGISTPFLMVGIGSGLILLFALSLVRIYKNNKALAIGLFVLMFSANLLNIFTKNLKGSVIFSIQHEMILSHQLPAIDYIYSDAGDEAFSVNTLTSPLWVNSTWSYLFNWYGLNKYGRLPEWHGRDQIGRLGNNLKPTSDETNIFYLIQEPHQGIPGKFIDDTVSAENQIGKLVDEKKFGQITVQKRIKNE